MTLTEFLLERIAEDEDVAREASTLPVRDVATGDWTHAPGEPAIWVAGDGYGSGAVERTNGDPHEVGIVVYDEGSPSEAEAAHIARHDPARVLAECEARRGIVALRHREMMLLGEVAESRGDHWEMVSDDRRSITRDEFLAQRNVLRLLALPYADHPDYRDEWKL